MTSRRGFLASLLAVTALPCPGWADVGDPAFLAAARDGEGAHWLHGISATGESCFALPLPARGHAATAHPRRAEAVAFARRPGRFAMVLDCSRGSVRTRLTPPEGRQFNGHGAYSADGALLYTSEVIAEGSAGRIGVWEVAAGYRRIGEWPSGGIGPHEILRHSDDVLVIANGGIQTDPSDRSKLNLGQMQPSLSYISTGGELLEQVILPPGLAQNSIRHLALSRDGLVAFAMQWEGDPGEAVPQLGLHRRGGAVQLCTAEPGHDFAMKGYAGSVAISRAGDLIGITSPVGGVVMLFNAAGEPVAMHRRADICGLSAGAEGLIATDGQGVIWDCRAEGLRPLQSNSNLAWDNHLIAL
ncbi:DUF1513 domain-containing protein [Pseudogemmobacter faecipullorum]|uniref:DUF1513 domain-containing protein n=1 Tax=Pseudogemmobacter faecipullorum TaxID=2755041 RepID=A0ABS8CLX9_9RHOB|nr:DUF1513 domain-containing protein [Pseudogemmobacter faecipullorum]MCB5410384.1 DUF1513 domain-containing protein [Pseudogemmobacter faecipullorum]